MSKAVVRRADRSAGLRRSASLFLLATALSSSCAFAAATGDAPSDATAAIDTAAAESEAAPAITVVGKHQAPPVTAGALGARSVLDTPLSIGQVNADQIARIAATTIDAAFAYDAGIHSNNSGVASGNTFSVRGLPIDRTNGYKVDGLPFPYWFQDQPVESLQAIEVLKGAGGFVYGFAPPGGVVNLVTKRPTNDFQAVFDLQYRSDSILRELIDLGGPLDRSGSLKFRLNAVNEQGHLYNGAYNKDQFVSLALTGGVTDRLSWQLDGFYQRTRQDDQVNSIAINTGTVKINGTTYGPVTSLKAVGGDFQPGERGTTKFNDIDSITGRVNYQIGSNWKASLAARYASLDERFPGSLATIYDNAGDYYSTVYNMNRLFKYYVLDATINGSFDTGPIHHTVVAGLSSLTDQFLYDNPTRNFILGTVSGSSTTVTGGYNNVQIFNIHNNDVQPSILSNPKALYNNRPPVWTLYQEVHQRAAYISDTADWGPLSILVGGRYTHYDEWNTNPSGGAISTFKYRPVTPIYAATLKLAKSIRAYFSYVEALQDGAIAPVTATNANATLGPLQSHQYEAGLKAEGHWGNASLAAYRIVQPSEYVDATNTFVRDGAARYQGIEFNAATHPFADLLLSASAAYLDAKQISGKPSLIGERIPGTTSFQASAQIEYTLPFLSGATVSGGVRHSGNALGGVATNTPNAFVFPGWTVGDLGAAYAFDLGGRAVKMRANVQNVTDVHYWLPNSLGTGLSAGQPRTFSLALQVGLNRPGEGIASFGGGRGGTIGGGHAYIGLDAGVALPTAFDAVAKNKVDDPGLTVAHAIDVHQQKGWDVDGVLGYDFGLFSAEIEAGFKRYGVGVIDYKDASVPVEVAAHRHPGGDYGDAGGRTGVLSVLFNGFVNIGQQGAAWRGFMGGGVGLARVSSGRWTLDAASAALAIGATASAGTNTDKSVANPTYFSDDNATALAWQAIAGVRHPITQWIDLTAKYRFFQIPDLRLRAESGNDLKGKLESHGLVLGFAIHL